MSSEVGSLTHLEATPRFTKDVYFEHPSVVGMSSKEVDDWRYKHHIKVSARRLLPRPVRSFVESSFPEHIISELQPKRAHKSSEY